MIAATTRPLVTTCHVEVVCSLTRPGEEVALVGETPELGNWDVSQALKLKTSRETFPTWMTEVPTCTPGTEFKLVIQKPNGVSWEPFEGNRRWPVEATDSDSSMRLRYGDRFVRAERAPSKASSRARTLTPPCLCVVPPVQPTAITDGAEAASSASAPMRRPQDKPPRKFLRPPQLQVDKPSEDALRRTRVYSLLPAAELMSPRSARSPRHAHFIMDNANRYIEDAYEIDTTKIGEGGFAVVRKARNKRTNAMRAVKAIPRNRLGDHVAFRREIATMTLMDHPNVIKLFETFEDRKSVYLVMELCLGGDLFDRLVEAKRFTEAQSAILMHQVLSGVFYMHERQVCHRDLKLENFLFVSTEPVERSTLKIIDFGLSCQFEKGQILTSKVGSPHYVSPQVLEGRYDQACDIWSCGILMYCLLSGRPPFVGRTDSETLRRIRTGTVSFDAPMWQEVSDGAKALIGNMLVRSVPERYTAEEALADEWVQLKEAEPKRGVLNTGILNRIREFKSQNLFKKAALHMIAWRFLPEEKLEALTAAFQALDENGDGTLTVDEIMEGFRAACDEVPADLYDMVAALDTNQSGEIDYTEFLAATLDKSVYLEDDACRSAFAMFDKDGDGKISAEELNMAIRQEEVDDATNKSALHDVMQEVDADGDGAINFKDFMQMMRGGA